jgi:phosphonoacetate hydrolase
MGATIVLTADHGMNDKHDAKAQPKVIYLQDVLDAWYRQGRGARDPADHRPVRGAPRRARLLRHCVLPAESERPGWIERIKGIPGMELVLSRKDACERFELPPDRIGDLVVVSEQSTVIGTSADRHDLSGLDVPLRSHGGVSEQRVPLVVQPRHRRH